MLNRFKNFFLLGLVTGLSLTLPLTYAEERQHPIDIKTETCIERDSSTVGMVQCVRQAEQLWDAKLNKVYKTLRSKLNATAKKQFKDAQLQWIKYRDAEFKAIEAIYSAIYEARGGGTIWGLNAANARVEIVKDRVLELNGYLADFE